MVRYPRNRQNFLWVSGVSVVFDGPMPVGQRLAPMSVYDGTPQDMGSDWLMASNDCLIAEEMVNNRQPVMRWDALQADERHTVRRLPHDQYNIDGSRKADRHGLFRDDGMTWGRFDKEVVAR